MCAVLVREHKLLLLHLGLELTQQTEQDMSSLRYLRLATRRRNMGGPGAIKVCACNRS